MADIARLTEVIEPVVKAMGLELVRVKLMSSEAGSAEPALQVMAEDPATGQLVLDQCAALSHAISDVLDALEDRGEEMMRGEYRLEVSSPGIDRPLTRAKDFADWAGHEAKIELTEATAGRKRFRGALEGIDAGGNVSLTDDQGERHTVPFGNIHSAKLVLTDKLIAATRPLDASGADEEILEEEEG